MMKAVRFSQFGGPEAGRAVHAPGKLVLLVG
jgi:hypothetical protein